MRQSKALPTSASELGTPLKSIYFSWILGWERAHDKFFGAIGISMAIGDHIGTRFSVLAGLDPAIHVDPRVKPGGDDIRG
jgi:hypothetical protein